MVVVLAHAVVDIINLDHHVFVVFLHVYLATVLQVVSHVQLDISREHLVLVHAV